MYKYLVAVHEPPTDVLRSSAPTPLFLVPAAGSAFFSFIKLAKMLRVPRPVYSFDLAQLPMTDGGSNTGSGESGEVMHSGIEQIAATLLQELRQVQPTGPYLLGGHCSGGLVALAMASQLEAVGETVERLLLLESTRPIKSDLGYKESDHVPTEFVDYFVRQMDLMKDRVLDSVRHKLARLPEQYAQSMLERTRQQIDAAGDYAAPAVNAAIVLFRTDAHPEVLYGGWHQFGRSGFEECKIPGDTDSMLTEPHVRQLAQTLEIRLHQDDSPVS